MNLPATTQQAVVAPKERRFRSEVPKEHRSSLDTRIMWMWNQRLGTIQTIWQASQGPRGDVLDFTAATLVLQASMGRDLDSIQQVFQRIEGGALTDDEIAAREEPTTMRL